MIDRLCMILPSKTKYMNKKLIIALCLGALMVTSCHYDQPQMVQTENRTTQSFQERGVILDTHFKGNPQSQFVLLRSEDECFVSVKNCPNQDSLEQVLQTYFPVEHIENSENYHTYAIGNDNDNGFLKRFFTEHFPLETLEN